MKLRQGKGPFCQKNLKTQSIPPQFENKAGQQYRVKTTYITTFFFFLFYVSLNIVFVVFVFCFILFYTFLFYSLLACVVILSHCVSFFLLSFCLNVERIVSLNLFQPILKKKAGQRLNLSKEFKNSFYSILF